MRLLFLAALSAVACSMDVKVTNHWNGGFQGMFTLHTDQALHGWKVHLTFSHPINSLEIWNAKVIQTLNGNKEFVVENVDYDVDLAAGSDLKVDFVARQDGDQVPTLGATLEGSSGGTPVATQSPGSSGTGTTVGGGGATASGGGATTAGSGGLPGVPTDAAFTGTRGSDMKYDYKKALSLSILFYDAQRSGKLPANNPIPWRGDSNVHDADAGHDLSGGWYDAGDHVKFNLPMAFSTMALGWGFLRFKDAYDAAGQTDMMCDMIKWPLDYFLKCWIPNEQIYYVQVGDGDSDHAYWGRAENMNIWRNGYKVDANHPGSDVAGDTASAFAVGYLIFKDICHDQAYADRLLDAGKSIYQFAKNHRGIYSQSVPQAQNYYGSDGYMDELTAAAAFMYQATNDAAYLQDAESFWQGGLRWGMSWGAVWIVTDVLLYEFTHKAVYKKQIEDFIKSYEEGGSVPRTPCGLVFRDKWGSNRYGANAGFIALVAAADGMHVDDYKKFAMSQINYILGDNKYHMSYEIGFGSNFPRRPHHRGSSCPTWTWECHPDGGPNPNQLNGALVGGPDQNDNYADDRGDYVRNEVACDFNAGFHSALAGLIHFAVNNELPPAPGAKC